MGGSTIGQVRHGGATTTHVVGAAIQRSQASIAELSQELEINSKTVVKGRKRQTLEDLNTGPRETRSNLIHQGEEAIVIVFLQQTLLPLDDRLYALQPSFPHLTWSAPERCRLRPNAKRINLQNLDLKT